MRQLSVLVIFLTFSLKCFGQNPSNYQEYKNEIAVHFLSYSTYHFTDKYGRISVRPEVQPLFNILNGITYKRFVKRHILRASFTKRTISNINHAPQHLRLYKEGIYNENILKLGYERNLNNRNLTPYFAADLALFYINYKGSSTNEYGSSIYNLKGQGIGFTPAFGLKLKLTEALSLNAETCLDLPFFKFNHEETTPHLGKGNYSTNNFDPIFNPLQKLSINVKF